MRQPRRCHEWFKRGSEKDTFTDEEFEMNVQIEATLSFPQDGEGIQLNLYHTSIRYLQFTELQNSSG